MLLLLPPLPCHLILLPSLLPLPVPLHSPLSYGYLQVFNVA